jgi:hypothetical protein
MATQTKPQHTLPEPLVEALADHFARQAKPKAGSLTLDPNQRQQLEQLLGKNFQTSAALLDAVRHASTVQLDNLQINLKPRLLDRLKTRAIGVDFDRYLNDLVIRLLEVEVGLR